MVISVFMSWALDPWILYVFLACFICVLSKYICYGNAACEQTKLCLLCNKKSGLCRLPSEQMAVVCAAYICLLLSLCFVYSVPDSRPAYIWILCTEYSSCLEWACGLISAGVSALVVFQLFHLFCCSLINSFALALCSWDSSMWQSASTTNCFDLRKAIHNTDSWLPLMNINWR